MKWHIFWVINRRNDKWKIVSKLKPLEFEITNDTDVLHGSEFKGLWIYNGKVFHDYYPKQDLKNYYF